MKTAEIYTYTRVFLPCLFLTIFSFSTSFAATNRSGQQKFQPVTVGAYSHRTTTNVSAPVYNQNNTINNKSVEKSTDSSVTETPEAVKKNKEREICLSNNIGIGNTFVWASRFSDTSSYVNMIEDSANPQNNVCFVKVELKSKDESRISVADVPSKYFMWGEKIECGSWANKKDLEKRILDARKGARVGGIVASTVGGVALGVGSMELFGNKLIGGKVEGQKSLSERELLRSQILTLQKSNQTEYDRIIKSLDELESLCGDSTLWQGTNKPADCDPERNLFMGLRDLL